jgi:hypothetical protein
MRTWLRRWLGCEAVDDELTQIRQELALLQDKLADRVPDLNLALGWQSSDPDALRRHLREEGALPERSEPLYFNPHLGRK